MKCIIVRSEGLIQLIEGYIPLKQSGDHDFRQSASHK